jgi:AbrB family looped-hinge helix DNA binding protein
MTTSTITSKGQTTIPKDVRTLLGLEPTQQVSYEVKDGYVIMRPVEGSLDRFAGILKSNKPAVPKSEARRAAARSRGKRYAAPR